MNKIDKNSGNVHIGDNINGDVNYGVQVFNQNINAPSVPQFMPDKLYSSEFSIPLAVRWLLAVVISILEVLGFTSIEKQTPTDFLIHAAEIFRSIESNIGSFIGIILVFLIVILTIYLWASVFSLSFKKHCGNLIYSKKKVVRIKPHKCPKCGNRMSVAYNEGNYVICKVNRREHRWLIEL